MPAPRSLPLRSVPRLRASRTTRSFPNAGPWRHSGQRGYASASETAKEAGQKVKSSELPWVAGAVGVTVLGTYTVMHGGKLGPILDHPLPGDNYHGEGHGEEHEEAEGEEEGEEGGGEEQSEGGGDGEGEGEDSTQSSDSNEKDDSQSEQLGAGTAESVVEELSEGEESGEEGQKGVGVGKLAEATELERGPQGQRRFLIPSAKGGNMRRIESPKGIVQGRAEGQTEGGSIGDVKDGSKSAVAGQTSRAQKGISNTDTKHSTDLMADPEKSKKSEGVPETAKIQGTVDPSRKAV